MRVWGLILLMSGLACSSEYTGPAVKNPWDGSRILVEAKGKGLGWEARLEGGNVLAQSSEDVGAIGKPDWSVDGDWVILHFEKASDVLLKPKTGELFEPATAIRLALPECPGLRVGLDWVGRNRVWASSGCEAGPDWMVEPEGSSVNLLTGTGEQGAPAWSLPCEPNSLQVRRFHGVKFLEMPHQGLMSTTNDFSAAWNSSCSALLVNEHAGAGNGELRLFLPGGGRSYTFGNTMQAWDQAPDWLKKAKPWRAYGAWLAEDKIWVSFSGADRRLKDLHYIWKTDTQIRTLDGERRPL